MVAFLPGTQRPQLGALAAVLLTAFLAAPVAQLIWGSVLRGFGPHGAAELLAAAGAGAGRDPGGGAAAAAQLQQALNRTGARLGELEGLLQKAWEVGVGGRAARLRELVRAASQRRLAGPRAGWSRAPCWPWERATQKAEGGSMSTCSSGAQANAAKEKELAELHKAAQEREVQVCSGTSF